MCRLLSLAAPIEKEGLDILWTASLNLMSHGYAPRIAACGFRVR